MCCLFFFYSYGDPRDLHSFPTRRSSDLIQPCDISIRAVYVAVCAGRDLYDNFPAPLHGWAVSSDKVVVMSAIVLLHSQRRTAALYSEYGMWKLRSRNRSSRGMIMIEMKLPNAARATSNHRLFNQSANPRRNKTKAR